MSFRKCILDKVNDKLITKGQAQTFLNKYDTLFERYKKTMNDEAAAGAAAQKLVSIEVDKLKAKKRNQMNAAATQINTVADLEKRMKRNGTSFDLEIRNLLERAHTRGQAIFAQYGGMIGEFIEKNRSKWAGLTQDSSNMQNVVRAILGETTDNADANMFGKQIQKAFDTAHSKYEASGGVIGKIKNYFPQVHTPQLVRKASADEWINFLLPKLDRERMINDATGLPFTDEDLVKIMRQDHEDISTNGASQMQRRADKGLQTHGFGGDVADKRSSSRFYHFKDADSFLAYNERFGVGNTGLFDAVLGHLQVMARDTGTLEIMGAKPNGLMRHLNLQMEGTKHKASRVKKAWVNGMFDVLVGRTYGDGEQEGWFKALSNLQQLMISAYLGSAPLSAISDSSFVVLASRYNGLSSTQSLKKYFKQMNPANASDRRMMARSGYIAEVAGGSSISAARFSHDINGTSAFRWLASFTNRASGLEAMTQAAKNAVTLELQGQVAEFIEQGVKFSDLPQVFREAALNHGIDDSVWEIFSAAKLFKHPESGASFLRPDNVAQVKGFDKKDILNAASVLGDWSQSIRATASNEPQLRTRAITTGAILGDASPNTLNRAMVSSLALFKGFPITVMFNHVLGSIKDARKGRLGNLAVMFTGTTMLGAMAIQLRDMLKGKDPRDMSDHKFWMASALQGGGLGLYGDFMFADYSRFGRSPIIDFLGPVVGFANDITRLPMGNFQRSLDDESYQTMDKFLSDTFTMAKRHIPAGNLWYSRLVLERSILDQAEEMIDPKFNEKRLKRERRMQRDYGQRYWWSPGETAPDRAPDFENAVGG